MPPEPHHQLLGITPGVAIQATRKGGANTAQAAFKRGRESETRVLNDLGLPKNTGKVSSPEGNSIPDALTDITSFEIKDTKSVCCNKQVRIQTDAAKASGRESVLVTGTKTDVNSKAEKAFDTVVRRDDLGPQ